MVNFGRNRFGSIPPVIKNLLLLNIFLFVLTAILGYLGSDLTRSLGLYYFKSDLFRPYQLITHMFLHGGLTHIFLNMFMLWMFGRILQRGGSEEARY